ncbi:TRAP transporter substrate-binding protein DctP [Pusillimonas noertemannii]|uniref:TRAP transporter substrate-binding protein DctP n=1 Tax=Pusillimonas noertemannii TaxID=305977 RepID=UPI000302EC8D|nr:TRAP transporter substrate-binding protein DctP [Pusillimonas noertemannii]
MLRRLLFLAVASAGIAAASAVQAKTLTLLSSWDNNYNAVPVFVDKFVERVKDKTNGDLTIQVRGPETVPPFEQLQPVSSGLFDLLFTHGAYHLGETGMAFGMDAVKDDPAARRASGIYELIDKHYNERNLKLLGVFSNASGYHILLKKPIGADGALQGRKIRASSTYHEMIQALNGAVVTLPASEIFSALERGVVDGAAWPVFGAMEYRWYEVADHMTRPTFGVTNQTMFVNLDSWNDLSPEQQRALEEAAKEIEVEGRAEFEKLWAKEDADMQKAGLAITQFGPEVAPKVNTMFADGVWKQVEQHAGADGQAFHKLAVEKGLALE